MQASKQTQLLLITYDIKEWLCMLMLLEINHTSIQKVKDFYIFSSRIVQFITATAYLCLVKE
jgi:hypothetical protein